MGAFQPKIKNVIEKIMENKERLEGIIKGTQNNDKENSSQPMYDCRGNVSYNLQNKRG
jgi:hypothetical protein